MNLSEYQEKARSTAVYTDIENISPLYPTLGLIGECGEVAEKIKKLFRDDGGNITAERAIAVSKELGDCCWYLANICCDADIELEIMNTMKKSSDVHMLHSLELPRLVLYLNRHANLVAEILEQWHISGTLHPITSNKFISFTQFLSRIIACIDEIASRFEFTLEQIYTDNIDKLFSRQKRGTLHGDGDTR